MNAAIDTNDEKHIINYTVQVKQDKKNGMEKAYVLYQQVPLQHQFDLAVIKIDHLGGKPFSRPIVVNAYEG